VRDPFAARLAGERGPAIVQALPHPEILRMGLAIRTRFLDSLLLLALRSYPIATVLSVGCGLDTRPWRLEFPQGSTSAGSAPGDVARDLRWIEVDFADVLDYKERILAGETPRCRRERLVADVNDPAQRRAMFEAAGQLPSLMITEGLLPYLPGSTVDALADECWKQSGVAHWISDVTTSAFSKALGAADSMNAVRHVRASDSLKGEEILDLLRRHGWTTAVRRSYISDTAFAWERIRRRMGGKEPPRPAMPAGDPSGVHRFMRA